MPFSMDFVRTFIEKKGKSHLKNKSLYIKNIIKKCNLSEH